MHLVLLEVQRRSIHGGCNNGTRRGEARRPNGERCERRSCAGPRARCWLGQQSAITRGSSSSAQQWLLIVCRRLHVCTSFVLGFRVAMEPYARNDGEHFERERNERALTPYRRRTASSPTRSSDAHHRGRHGHALRPRRRGPSPAAPEEPRRRGHDRRVPQRRRSQAPRHARLTTMRGSRQRLSDTGQPEPIRRGSGRAGARAGGSRPRGSAGRARRRRARRDRSPPGRGRPPR